MHQKMADITLCFLRSSIAQGLIDLETWMIDSTVVRATRASSGAGKKGGLKNRKTTPSVEAGAA